jgi:phosphatidylserine synthase
MTVTSPRPNALGVAVLLVSAHLALSLAAIVALVVLRNHRADATSDAWVHGVIVAATAALLVSFTVRARSGNAGAYRRMRISSAVLLVALVVIVAIPGDFPTWMKLLEAVSAVCLLVLVAAVNRRQVRARFHEARPED